MKIVLAILIHLGTLLIADAACVPAYNTTSKRHAHLSDVLTVLSFIG